MSRVGNLPIAIPQGVEVTIDDGIAKVSGPKGELTQAVPTDIAVQIDDGNVVVSRPSDVRQHRALHGLTRALLANMVEGVTKGFEIVLEVRGVGYRAQMEGSNLVLQVGYSHPVEIEPRPGISFDAVIEPGTRQPVVYVRGINKQVVGQQAAEVRKVRPPEPYKGKGIRYRGEYVKIKAGKAGKAGAK